MADALATLLVEGGAITPEALLQAQARQREQGGALDTALLELRLIPEEQLTGLLARAARLPPAPPGGLREPDSRARRVFPAKVAERHGLAPFRLDGKELHVAACHPVDQAVLDEIGFMLSLPLVAHVAPELRIRELQQTVYGTTLGERFARLASRLAEEPIEASPPAPAPPPAPPPGRPARTAAPPAAPRRKRSTIPGMPLPPLPQPVAPPRRARWDLAQAREALAGALHRDEVFEVALRYARQFFEHAAVLAISRGRLRGHDARGLDAAAPERARSLLVAVGRAGILRAVLQAGGPYLGPPGTDPVVDAVLAGLGRERPRTLLLYPVMVGERAACLLYADNGEAPVSTQRVGDLLLLAGELGGVLGQIVRARKRAARRHGGGPAEAPPERAGQAGSEEADGEPAPHAPPPFDPALAAAELQETARGSAERGRLVALLVQHGPEAAAELARVLPGPIDARVASHEESSPVDERGPVLAALAALGIVATPYLISALGEPDARRRRYAALLLGHIGDPAAFLALADLVLDPDPAVAEAALAALEGLRGHADFRPVLERLRRALEGEAARSTPAARALVRLRDGGAVEALLPMLEGANAAVAEEALRDLSARSLGRDPADWSVWWAAQRGRTRNEWLFEALEDPDRAVRLAAADALRLLGATPVRYFADAPEAERGEAARAWRRWFAEQGLSA